MCAWWFFLWVPEIQTLMIVWQGFCVYTTFLLHVSGYVFGVGVYMCACMCLETRG